MSYTFEDITRLIFKMVFSSPQNENNYLLNFAAFWIGLNFKEKTKHF